MPNIIRIRRVEAKTGLTKSPIYAGVAVGTFPPPIRLGPHSVGWIEEEIDAWIEARKAERDSGKRPPIKAGRPKRAAKATDTDEATA